MELDFWKLRVYRGLQYTRSIVFHVDVGSSKGAAGPSRLNTLSLHPEARTCRNLFAFSHVSLEQSKHAPAVSDHTSYPSMPSSQNIQASTTTLTRRHYATSKPKALWISWSPYGDTVTWQHGESPRRSVACGRIYIYSSPGPILLLLSCSLVLRSHCRCPPRPFQLMRTPTSRKYVTRVISSPSPALYVDPTTILTVLRLFAPKLTLPHPLPFFSHCIDRSFSVQLLLSG